MHWIDKEVKYLMEKYQTTDPFELADCLNYKLLPYPFRRIKGMLLVVQGVTIIGYSTSISRRQQGFVILHEIAHRRLHQGLNYFMVLENSLYPPGKFERQANRFVACLVLTERMPQPGETIYDFATRYGVPVDVLREIEEVYGVK